MAITIVLTVLTIVLVLFQSGTVKPDFFKTSVHPEQFKKELVINIKITFLLWSFKTKLKCNLFKSHQI